MTALRIGAHVDQADPLAEAAARGADLVQIFLGDPQGWKDPTVAYAGGAAALRAGRRGGRHRPLRARAVRPQRRHRQQPDPHPQPQAARPARRAGRRDRRQGADRARRARRSRTTTRRAASTTGRKTFERSTPPLPVLIENTAGGDNAMARRLDRVARLWEVLEDRVEPRRPGQRRLLPRHLPRARRRRGARRRRRPGQGRSPGGSTWCTPTTRGTPSTPAPTGTPTSAAGRSTATTSSRSWRPRARRWSCETPGGAAGQGADIAFLRERLPG